MMESRNEKDLGVEEEWTSMEVDNNKILSKGEEQTQLLKSTEEVIQTAKEKVTQEVGSMVEQVWGDEAECE